jgi:arylsulfatase A
MAAASLALPAFARQNAEAASPNVVVILADDMGWGSMNCYGADPKMVRTPNLDRLAAQGRRFTDAVAPSSVCTPTRYALLTGRYCWRTPLKSGVIGNAPLIIEPGRLTLASLLKKRGYQTAAIGKWHLGFGDGSADYRKPLRPGPLEVGFDTYFGVPLNHGDATGIYVENDRIWRLRSDRKEPFGESFYGNPRGAPYHGYDAPQRQDSEVMDVITDRSVAWLERQTPGVPFFLYCPLTAPHEPVTPSEKMKGTSGCGPYGDYLHDVDRCVGRLLDALDRRKLTENTLVLFTSDNGGENKRVKGGQQAVAIEAGLAMNGPYRAGKHSIYEGGTRVPFLARWPGRIPTGTVTDAPISLVDIPATVASMIGEKLLPVSAGVAEDSCDVSADLLGKAGGSDRPPRVVHSADGVFAVRDGRWKWIEGVPVKQDGRRKMEYQPQLYDLAADPGETTNVLTEHPETVAQLSKRLEGWRASGRSRP